MFRSHHILTCILLAFVLSACQNSKKTSVLVFSKTEGFRHESIPAGIKAIEELGQENNFDVIHSEDADMMNQKTLKDMKVVVFLNTTLDILNPAQQIEFQRFIQAGGGFVGIHAAADTEYEWPWYGGLVGAYFNGHPNNPNVREAVVRKTENEHASTTHLPEAWTRNDEWYNYRNINPDITPILNLDETTYEGGTNGESHPIAWYHEYDGGRSFYTGGGHTDESFEDPAFRLHLLEGIRYAMGDQRPVDYGLVSVMPEENRFQKVVLDSYFNEPMELEMLPDGRLVFIERKGAVKLYNPATGKTENIANIEVYSGQEDGLMGIAVHPEYDKNQWVFLCYSDPEESHQNISRFRFDPDAEEVFADEVVMLTIPTQRLECCHSAGSIEFGPEGHLWASFGDNTNPHQSNGYDPIDERDGRVPFDAQKSAGNPNDLRGAIIRIHPEDDGTYSIPDGNLFSKDGSQGRPEIYVMGCRNPFRFSIDPNKYVLYWGEVGPDAQEDDPERGPRGYDEVNQAKKPGFYGWPYFVGDNKPYRDYNFQKMVSGDPFDPAKPFNDSPNNTGVQNLPPAQAAMVWYPYAKSDDFPLVGTGGRNAMAGPVFYKDNYPENPNRYPEYYDGKFFMYDWMRGWIMAVSFDENGDYKNMEPFLPSTKWNNLMDVIMSPQGDMYMIEYGTGWFTANEDARLVHLKYTPGNRTPTAILNVDQTAGKLPFVVQFNADGSFDQDGDKLTYSWDFGDGSKGSGKALAHTYQNPGEYQAVLTVTDGQGLKGSNQVKIYAGNQPPELELIISGNQSFYWPGKKINYEVLVNDPEDGQIDKTKVAMTIDYLEMGYDLTEIAQGHQLAADVSANHPGLDLIQNSDCRSCHQIEGPSIGPSYIDVSKKYNDEEEPLDYLTDKIISGGGGVWGETPMAAHPALSKEDATKMASYIMTLAEPSTAVSLGSEGAFTFAIPDGKMPGGSFVLMASYTDGGAEGIGPMKSLKTKVLRSATILPHTADVMEKASKFTVTPEMNPMQKEDMTIVMVSDGSILTYKNIDLDGIRAVAIVATASARFASGGTIEILLDDINTDPPLGKVELKVSEGFGMPENLIVPIPLQKGRHDLILKIKGKEEGSMVGALMMLVLNEGQAM